MNQYVGIHDGFFGAMLETVPPLSISTLSNGQATTQQPPNETSKTSTKASIWHAALNIDPCCIKEPAKTNDSLALRCRPDPGYPLTSLVGPLASPSCFVLRAKIDARGRPDCAQGQKQGLCKKDGISSECLTKVGEFIGLGLHVWHTFTTYLFLLCPDQPGSW